ncbi:MAG TPA: glycosyltransferase family 39 protein, partial [Myxococcota bacterium]
MIATDTARPSARARDALALGVIVVVTVLLALLVGVQGEFPLNDDWAYAWSAQHFADTGEMRILDWAAPSLIAHLAWGALVVKLAGPSYVALRVGTLAFAATASCLLYVLARKSALSSAPALAMALALSTSPWWAAVSFTYLTDVPWLAAMLGAFVCAACASVTMSARSLAWWAAASVLVGLAALSRQFAVIALPAFVLLALRDARAQSEQHVVRGFIARS